MWKKLSLTVFLLFFASALQAFVLIEDYPSATGARFINQVHPHTGFPIHLEVFYPIPEGLPATKTEGGLWQLPALVRNAPVNGKQGPYPLIVITHGDSGNRWSLAWLASILAEQGYIVAAVDHYGASWPEVSPFITAQRWLRPLDVTQAITAMLNDEQFGPHIDKERIGVIGFSTGSLTALWIAGGIAEHYVKPSRDRTNPFSSAMGLRPEELNAIDFSYAKQSFADSRVKAAVLLSPTFGSVFDRDSLRPVKIPVLIIASSGDEVADLDSNANFFGRWVNRSVLKVLPSRAGHYVFLNLPSEKGKDLLKKQWVVDPEDVDRKQIHLDTAGEIVDFFKLTLPHH